jgi:hypothetical protein
VAPQVNDVSCFSSDIVGDPTTGTPATSSTPRVPYPRTPIQ